MIPAPTGALKRRARRPQAWRTPKLPFSVCSIWTGSSPGSWVK
jgi:hypothetical protein